MILTINPVYQKLVPSVSEDEYKSIKQSIKDSGLWLPIIVTPKGIILDGHTRYQICQELKITPKHAERNFENELLEKRFVIESNLKRRQLNDFQKSELGIPLLEIENELAQQRKEQGTTLASNEAKGKSTEKVSNQIGISRSTFERAKKIIEKAPEETKEILRLGKSTINKEYQNLQKNEKRAIRQEEIKNLQVKLPEKVTLHNSEFQKVFVEGNSISLIFTDPPYHEKYLHLYESLAVHASRVLREGGSLICYAGHYAIGKIINMMEAQGLRFHWPIAVIHSGPSASVFGRKILVGYKPMLWFTKGKYEGEFVKDCIKSEFQGKEIHEWAQSTVESDYYIKYLTLENEIVYDPFLGQGTFGISAVKLNRQFIGCEVDKDHFENARRLISAASQT
ncbi:MAG: DNA methyltransferase [Methylococcaceae bacterium]